MCIWITKYDSEILDDSQNTNIVLELNLIGAKFTGWRCTSNTNDISVMSIYLRFFPFDFRKQLQSTKKVGNLCTKAVPVTLVKLLSYRCQIEFGDLNSKTHNGDLCGFVSS